MGWGSGVTWIVGDNLWPVRGHVHIPVVNVYLFLKCMSEKPPCLRRGTAASFNYQVQHEQRKLCTWYFPQQQTPTVHNNANQIIPKIILKQYALEKKQQSKSNLLWIYLVWKQLYWTLFCPHRHTESPQTSTILNFHLQYVISVTIEQFKSNQSCSAEKCYMLIKQRAEKTGQLTVMW